MVLVQYLLGGGKLGAKTELCAISVNDDASIELQCFVLFRKGNGGHVAYLYCFKFTLCHRNPKTTTCKTMAALKNISGLSAGVAFAYLVFVGAGFLVSYTVAAGEPSCILVMTAIAQCLGIVFLCIQVSSNKSASGISAKTVALDGFAIACRLSGTVWLNAYIPDDPTGDALYQAIEACSLVLSAWLFF